MMRAVRGRVSLDIPPVLQTAAAVWAALVGAVIGSFLNVVIARVPQGMSVVHPPSRCPRCGAGIRWYDNVPVLSWLLLRGRCRRCRAPISPRYPAVEALGAIAGLVAFQRHGLSLSAVAELGLVAVLLSLAFIDSETWTLPYELTVPLLAFGQGASAFGLTAAPSPRSSALGALVGWFAFAAVAWAAARAFRKEALGQGDVWLLSGIGAWLGAGALLPVVLLASTQGALVGGLIVLRRRRASPPADPAGAGGPGPDPAPPPALEAAPGPAPASPTDPAMPPEPVTAPAPAAEAGTQEPPRAERGEEDWVPSENAVPFGPFLAIAALEWLYFSAPLAGLIPVLRPFL